MILPFRSAHSVKASFNSGEKTQIGITNPPLFTTSKVTNNTSNQNTRSGGQSHLFDIHRQSSNLPIQARGSLISPQQRLDNGFRTISSVNPSLSFTSPPSENVSSLQKKYQNSLSAYNKRIQSHSKNLSLPENSIEYPETLPTKNTTTQSSQLDIEPLQILTPISLTIQNVADSAIKNYTRRHSQIETEMDQVFSRGNTMELAKHSSMKRKQSFLVQPAVKKVSIISLEKGDEELERLAIEKPGTFDRLNTIEFMHYKRKKSLMLTPLPLEQDSMNSINIPFNKMPSIFQKQSQQQADQTQPSIQYSLVQASTPHKILNANLNSMSQLDQFSDRSSHSTNKNNTSAILNKSIINDTQPFPFINTTNINNDINHNGSNNQMNVTFPQVSMTEQYPPINQPISQLANKISPPPKLIPQAQIYKPMNSYINDGNKSLAALAIGYENQHAHSSDQILKSFFPHYATKIDTPDAIKKKEKAVIQKKKRLEQYNNIFKELINKRKTFSKFAFKAAEQIENSSIRPVLEDLSGGGPKGSMNVVDLWSDKNVNKFLGNCKMIKDKLLINKIAAVKNRKGFFLDDKKPFLLSKKEEQKLINTIYMKEQSKTFGNQYAKQIIKNIQEQIDEGKNLSNSSLNKLPYDYKNEQKQKNSDSQIQRSLNTSQCIARRDSPRKNQQMEKKITHYSLSEEDEEDDNDENGIDMLDSNKSIILDESSSKKKVNFNQFLRQSQIIRTPGKYFSNSGSLKKQLSAAVVNPTKRSGLNMNKLIKMNYGMIKDLDYLQEQNNSDYTALVGKINHLQNKIVSQKVSRFDRGIIVDKDKDN